MKEGESKIEQLERLIPKFKANKKILPLKVECTEWELRALKLEARQAKLSDEEINVEDYAQWLDSDYHWDGSQYLTPIEWAWDGKKTNYEKVAKAYREYKNLDHQPKPTEVDLEAELHDFKQYVKDRKYGGHFVGHLALLIKDYLQSKEGT